MCLMLRPVHETWNDNRWPKLRLEVSDTLISQSDLKLWLSEILRSITLSVI